MAAATVEKSPFVRQLASSDRATRDKALESLRTYLHSNRDFNEVELLKLWRGLFFCMWHSDRPKTQQRLAVALSHLVLPLPVRLFVPFLQAFWTTMTGQYTLIDSLRLDKFLLLMRCYVNAAFTYLARAGWPDELLGSYLDDVIDARVLAGPGDVSDGLRYHVLDLWLDELEKVDGDNDQCPLEGIMEPIRRLTKEGRTKTVKDRAKECLADERLTNWGTKGGPDPEEIAGEDEEEWSGLEGEA